MNERTEQEQPEAEAPEIRKRLEHMIKQAKRRDEEAHALEDLTRGEAVEPATSPRAPTSDMPSLQDEPVLRTKHVTANQRDDAPVQPEPHAGTALEALLTPVRASKRIAMRLLP